MKVISIILGGAALALSTSLWASTNTNLSTTQLQSQQVKSFVENSYAAFGIPVSTAIKGATSVPKKGKATMKNKNATSSSSTSSKKK